MPDGTAVAADMVVMEAWARALWPWATNPRQITSAASSTPTAGQSAAIRVVHRSPRAVCCVRLPITVDIRRLLGASRRLCPDAQ
ncbi:hypothetical protein GCM10010094_42350 [Streptomyces flaveus]|uniref:Uncharacterized protein n=1 Tax=Streptomyces flaveus TaxID=66370 RepID=A0A917VGU8_9ACTN|nr:hypothetical protein GCM10010094_42350 [Streptomyces flaveus]